ncbi:MAG: hypothetical protein U0531_12295 [Dehalococcoidia bacterium]
MPAGARRELITILGHIRENPELFRMVDRGRYRGRRRALIAGRWHLYYRVIGPERHRLLDAIRDAVPPARLTAFGFRGGRRRTDGAGLLGRPFEQQARS